MCLEHLDNDRQSLLTQYFRQQAVYCRVTNTPSKERMFFSPLERSCVHTYDSFDPEDLARYVSTINTFKYLDRDTFACKVCHFYADSRETVIRHVNEFHIKPKRRMSDHDLVTDYIETEDIEDDGKGIKLLCNQ